jgi:hypothetical protein
MAFIETGIDAFNSTHLVISAIILKLECLVTALIQMAIIGPG